jgi:hypothetical protein
VEKARWKNDRSPRIRKGGGKMTTKRTYNSITSCGELKAAIRAVVDYNWEDERRDYQEHGGDPNHIFTTLQALDEQEAA